MENKKVTKKPTTKKTVPAKQTKPNKSFSPLSKATGGKVLAEEKKKMGRPEAVRKTKGYSVYLFEDDVKNVSSIVGDPKKPTPNDFVKDLYEKINVDADAMVEIIGIIYGTDSREAMLADFMNKKKS